MGTRKVIEQIRDLRAESAAAREDTRAILVEMGAQREEWRARDEEWRAECSAHREEWRAEWRARDEEWRAECSARREDSAEAREATRAVLAEIRALREESQALHAENRDMLRFVAEVVRRNEIAFRDMTKVLGELRDESRAHTKAIFTMIDRLTGGGTAPAT